MPARISLLAKSFDDNDYLTTGYFSLAFSKGKEAEIHIGYSEALYKQEEESTTK